MDISSNFTNSNNMYYGHGTGRAADNPEVDEIVQSIFETGLKCYGAEQSIGLTSIDLGEGSKDLYDENAALLNNWPHRDSTNIIIASVPKNLLFQPIHVGGVYSFIREAAFCNAVPQNNGEVHYYLKPEFIHGAYDAANKTYVPNPNYYENLDKKAQEKLFEGVKQNFKDNLIEQAKCEEEGFPYSSFAECQEAIAKTYGEEYKQPFTEEEIHELDGQLAEINKVIAPENTTSQQANAYGDSVGSMSIDQVSAEQGYEEGW